MPPPRPQHQDSDDGEDSSGSGEENERDQVEVTIDRLSKKLVRFTLASEYTRQPIRRTDITQKVLTPANSRLFKPVFNSAQNSLQSIFGMTLVELPLRERLTLTQKRAFARSQARSNNPSSTTLTSASASAQSKSYILTTTLPPAFRTPEILSAGSTNPKEESYVGIYTAICTLIALSGRSISEAKLTRHLLRLNADITTPIDRTEKVLAAMCRQGYLVKTKDNTGGETCFEYHLGPRAKLEIGNEGVVSLVREVYGVTAPEDLEERVGRNMGVEEVISPTTTAGAGAGGGRKRQATTQGGRGRGQHEDDEEEGEEVGDSE